MATKDIDTKSTDIASAVRKLGMLGSSTPLASRRALEYEYNRLYQALVKQGKARQIKKKYRVL